MKELENTTWPLYYRDELIVGNPKSNVAICTLWTKKELFLDLPKEEFTVIGNLRTTYGINPLIKNILANPRIRYIVVCGEDLMKTGENCFCVSTIHMSHSYCISVINFSIVSLLGFRSSDLVSLKAIICPK